MLVRSRSQLVCLLTVAALLAPALPVVAQAPDVEGARQRAAEVQQRLDEANARYEELYTAVEVALDELAELEARAVELEAEATTLDAGLAARAREVYMRGTGTTFELLLGEGGPDEAIQRASLAEVVQQRETARLEQALAARIALDQTRQLAEERRVELEVLRGEMEAAQAALEQELAAAQTRVRVLETLAARQRLIDTARQRGIYSCIMDRGITSFRDTWGAPRSGGRRHKGTDVMAPFNVPVYAFTSGVVARHSNSRLGGISLYLRGDDGATYFYTHLNGYAPQGAVGRRVVAGEHIAYNGATGNARGGAPHVHFERHPGGGAAENPYPYLVAACR